MTIPLLPDEHHIAAWWSSVIEPGDVYAHALRLALGDDEAIAWVCADTPGSLPLALERTAQGIPRDWETVWKRWHPRAVVADPAGDLEWIERVGGQLLIPSDSKWPEALNDLEHERPVCLWVRGHLLDRPTVAIVGSRACTRVGEKTAADMGYELASKGMCVVSGGAFGIDIAAHRGALASPPGPTIAVMAGGLERPYPVAHRQLFDEIVSHEAGALMSEVPPRWRPARWRFLTRNRVIAALAQATIVVEADQRSGALATARRAMELGRHVGAIPGPVTSAMSRGCHRLIREGGTLIRDSADVIEMVSTLDLNIGNTEPLFDQPQSPDHGIDALPCHQRRVWEALPGRAASSVDAITVTAGMSIEDVMSALGALELAGLAAHTHGRWKRTA